MRGVVIWVSEIEWGVEGSELCLGDRVEGEG